MDCKVGMQCRGGVSTHFVASLAVIAVVVSVLLLVQERAYNPTLVKHTTPTPRIPMPLVKTQVPTPAYSEATTIQTELKQPRGLALAGKSTLYIVGDRSLAKFNNTGRRIEVLSLSSEPYAVGVSPNGTVYIGYRDYVEARKGSGEISEWPKLGSRGYITSIAAKDDRVWVADAGGRRVLEYDPEGKLLRTLGEKDASKHVPGLVVPSAHLDVGLDSKGSLWVSNPGRHRMEQYNEDGSVTRSWGRAGAGLEHFCGCCNPTDFAIGPGDVFVTSEKGLYRVKEFSSEGSLRSLVATGKEFGGGAICDISNAPPVVRAAAGGGLDLAVAADGSIYVLDTMSSVVRVFKPK